MSGQLPVDSKTENIVQGDIKTQTRQVLENIKAIVKASGCDLEDVVKTTIYLKDMEDFQAVNEIYAGYFNTSKPPVRVAVEVARLPKDVKIEIEAIAGCKDE